MSTALQTETSAALNARLQQLLEIWADRQRIKLGLKLKELPDVWLHVFIGELAMSIKVPHGLSASIGKRGAAFKMVHAFRTTELGGVGQIALQLEDTTGKVGWWHVHHQPDANAQPDHGARVPFGWLTDSTNGKPAYQGFGKGIPVQAHKPRPTSTLKAW